jgi:gliding motility-associated-like protein
MFSFRKHCLFFIFLFGYSVAHAQIDLNNGLVTWLPFSGTMNDASGNGNTGLPQGTSYTADRFGATNRAVFLNGVDEYITLRDSLGQFSSTPFSIVLWIQPSSNKYSCLIGKRNFGPTNSQQYQMTLFRPFFGLFSGITSNALPCLGDLTLDVMNVTSYPTNFCVDSWHNIIITFDGNAQRMYFDGVMVDETPSTFPAMQQCNADIRLGNWWSGDPLFFGGKMDDFRWYNRVINAEEINALAADKGPAAISKADFIQERTTCTPLGISLASVPFNTSNVLWRFGDGNSASSSSVVTHTYAAQGLYPVTLVIDENGVCRDSITKLIDMSVLSGNVIVTPDTTVCVGDTVSLRTIPAQAFCWSPATVQLNQLDDPSGKLPIQAPQNLSLVMVPDDVNLVSNGDFELGNQNFSTQYNFITQRSADAQYGIVVDPRTWYSIVNCRSCVDHTGSTGGKLLVVDGSTDSSLSVWCQTITAAVNTNYTLSIWVNKYSTPELATLGLFIDGVKMIEVNDGNNFVGEWRLYSFDWNSGSKTSFDFCIKLTSTSSTGNLIGIDDISIKVKRVVQENIRIDVSGGPPLLVSSDTSICQGQTAQLKVTGGINNSWTPTTGLSDPNSANPFATPNFTTKYYVVSDAGACSSKDSVLVVVNPTPTLIGPAQEQICEGDSVQLTISGASTYIWSPASGLNDPLVSSPIAFPTETTSYLVSGTNDNGCTATALVKVVVFSKTGFFIPNAFTPNNDGKNDCFRIPNAEGGISYELAVFNRYGERVFFSRDPSECWNGRFKGSELPIGTYAYYLNLTTSCEVIRKKGVVNLIR